MTETCPRCGAAVESRRSETGPVGQRCGGCGSTVFARADGPWVVLGHANEAATEQIGAVLLRFGCRVAHGLRGEDVIGLAARLEAPAIVVDVALDQPWVFDVIARVRAERPGTGIILVSSIYDRAAYKRRPTTLYGADAYVEQHHVPDMLPEKLGRWVQAGGDLLPETLRRRLVGALRQADAHAGLAGQARVEVLARRIVADIALYHEAELHAGPRRDTLLEAALNEGRRLLREAVGSIALADGRDAIAVAYARLIANLGSGP